MNIRLLTSLILLSLLVGLVSACGAPNGKLKAEIEGKGSSAEALSGNPPPSPSPGGRFPEVGVLTGPRYAYRAYFQKGGVEVTEQVLSGNSRDYDSFVLAIPAAGIQDGWKLEDGRQLAVVVESLVVGVYKEISGNPQASFDLDPVFQEAIGALSRGSTNPLSYDLGSSGSRFKLEIRQVRGVSKASPQQIFFRIAVNKLPS